MLQTIVDVAAIGALVGIVLAGWARRRRAVGRPWPPWADAVPPTLPRARPDRPYGEACDHVRRTPVPRPRPTTYVAVTAAGTRDDPHPVESVAVARAHHWWEWWGDDDSHVLEIAPDGTERVVWRAADDAEDF